MDDLDPPRRTKAPWIAGWRVLARFRADHRGATAAEFALVVFPLFTLLMLVLEVGLTFWTGAALDHGVQGATRAFYTEGSSGAAPGAIAESVRKTICEGSGGLINCDKVKVDLSYYASLGDMVIQSPVDAAKQDWRAGFGDAHACSSTSQVVVIQAALAQRSFHTFVAGFSAFKDGSRLIQAASVVRIEPKSAGLQGC